MAHSALVGVDVLEGERLVQLLEAGGIKPSVALWLLTNEYTDWRFVIAAKSLDGLKPFDQVKAAQDVLRETLPVDQLPTLRIISTQDGFARSLRKAINRPKPVEGVRIEGQFVGDRFVEDAYVYRLR